MTVAARRNNMYPAACIRCGQRIPGDEGWLARHPETGKWAADHKGDCPETKAPVFAEPGYYTRVAHDGTTEYLVVVQNREKTTTYAKRLAVTVHGGVCQGHYNIAGNLNYCGQPAQITGDLTDHGCLDTRTTVKWEYAPGLGRAIGEAGLTPLTIEEAAAWGHLHGFCMICCRPLTDPASVTRGIGPVCIKKVTR